MRILDKVLKKAGISVYQVIFLLLFIGFHALVFLTCQFFEMLRAYGDADDGFNIHLVIYGSIIFLFVACTNRIVYQISRGKSAPYAFYTLIIGMTVLVTLLILYSVLVAQ